MKRHRTREYSQLMNSHRWRRLRRAYLALHPLCEDCLLDDRTTIATEVHHVQPIESAPGHPDEMARLCFDADNLRALCHRCHVEEHRIIASGSRERAKERAKDALGSFAKRYL